MEHQTIGVDQEIFAAGNFCRDMGEDQVIPAIQGNQPVTSGQVYAGLPFGSRHLILEADNRQCVGNGHDEFLGFCY